MNKLFQPSKAELGLLQGQSVKPLSVGPENVSPAGADVKTTKSFAFTEESLSRCANKIVENMMKKNLRVVESSSSKGLTPPQPKPSVAVKKGQQQTKSKNVGTPASLGKNPKQ